MTDSIESEDQETPEFVDRIEKELFDRARKGMAAQTFLDSEMGRIVLDRMRDDVNKAMEALLVATGMEVVKKHQTKAAVAEQAVQWLIDVIAEGDEAYSQLQQNKDE
jgi:hypothetical protein